MKMNRSLGISTEIQKQLDDDRLGLLNSVYPKELLNYIASYIAEEICRADETVEFNSHYLRQIILYAIDAYEGGAR